MKDYEKTLVGCFVKISEKTKYEIAEIINLENSGVYEVESTKTDKCLKGSLKKPV